MKTIYKDFISIVGEEKNKNSESGFLYDGTFIKISNIIEYHCIIGTYTLKGKSEFINLKEEFSKVRRVYIQEYQIIVMEEGRKVKYNINRNLEKRKLIKRGTNRFRYLFYITKKSVINNIYDLSLPIALFLNSMYFNKEAMRIKFKIKIRD